MKLAKAIKKVLPLVNNVFGGHHVKAIPEELENEMSMRMIERRRDKAEWLAANLKNTMVLFGDGTDVEFLKAENIQDADSFISVTENEKTR